MSSGKPGVGAATSCKRQMMREAHVERENLGCWLTGEAAVAAAE